MKEANRQALTQLGMDIDQTLARFVGNEGLLAKFLRRFLDDKTFEQLRQAVASGSQEDAFRAAHTLKGVSGNLGLGNLFQAVDPMVEAFRANDTVSGGQLFSVVEAEYERAVATIRSFGEDAL